MNNPLAPYRHDVPTLPEFLNEDQIAVVQRKEIAEFFGFETRNKYSLHTARGAEIAFAAEQGKGFLAGLARQFFGHWRAFDLHVFGPSREMLLIGAHPFRFFFSRLEVRDARGTYLGAIQKRFAVFSKAFDVEDASGRVLLTVRSPFFRIWTFSFQRDGRELAKIEKKWSGFLTEMFTDADRFLVSFTRDLGPVERALVTMAALYVDLMYFEEKASGGSNLLGAITD